MNRYSSRAAGFILATAVAVSLAACNSDSSDDAAGTTAASGSTGSSTESGTAENASYPLTVSTKYGDITLDSRPERVVALDYSAADDLVALGITPVGVATDPSKVESDMPWLASDIKDAANPDIAPMYEANVETVANLAPDLIVGGTYNAKDRDAYDKLSAVAPTLIPDMAGKGSWQDRLTATAAAFGATDKAGELIAETEDAYKAAGEKVPGIGDKTVSYYQFTGDKFNPGGPEVFELFGMKPTVGMQEKTRLSMENAQGADANLIVIWATGDDGPEILENTPAFANLPAVKKGNLMFTTPQTKYAFDRPGILSLKWFLDEITPTIGKLAD
jgi:iron complex transport system substrate-binding protein